MLLFAVAAFGVLAYRLGSSTTDVTSLLEQVFPNPFGLNLLSPKSEEALTAVVTIAWTAEKLQPAAVVLRYTSDPLPYCGACPKPTWHTLAQMPGDVTSYAWDASSLPPGDYRVEVIVLREKDRRSVYSSLLRINGGKAAGAKGSGRPARGG